MGSIGPQVLDAYIGKKNWAGTQVPAQKEIATPGGNHVGRANAFRMCRPPENCFDAYQTLHKRRSAPSCKVNCYSQRDWNQMTQRNEKQPPWKKPRPKLGKRIKLSEEDKAAARARAERAGRRYPNLVDNMWASKRRKKSALDFE